MNLYTYYLSHVRNAVAALQASGALPGDLKIDAITVEPPRDVAHGDFATNAAMVLAGQAKQKPREVADALAEQLRKVADIEAVEVAGPGFINLRVTPETFTQLIPDYSGRRHWLWQFGDWRRP